MKNLLPDLSQYPVIALDTETTGLLQGVDKAFGVSITLPDLQDFYWDLRVQPQIIKYLNEKKLLSILNFIIATLLAIITLVVMTFVTVLIYDQTP